MVFGQNLKILVPAKYNIIGKGISRGAERHKFQLRSTFQRGVMSEKINLTIGSAYNLFFSSEELRVRTNPHKFYSRHTHV